MGGGDGREGGGDRQSTEVEKHEMPLNILIEQLCVPFFPVGVHRSQDNGFYC